MRRVTKNGNRTIQLKIQFSSLISNVIFVVAYIVKDMFCDTSTSVGLSGQSVLMELFGHCKRNIDFKNYTHEFVTYYIKLKDV